MHRLTLTWHIIFFMSGVLLIFSANADENAEMLALDSENVRDVKLIKTNSGRFEYEVKVLERALSLTTSEYGPYTFELVDFPYGTARGIRALAKGTPFNVNSAPMRAESVMREAGIIAVPHPIMRGLLGYRAFAAKKEDIDVIAEVSDQAALKQLVFGQGRGWIDALIYRDHGFSVVDNGRYEQLFTMLHRGRFDVLPLGINEIQLMVAEASSPGEHEEFTPEDFTVVPKLRLFYPLPVVYQLSEQHKKLAQRIALGLQRMEENGELETLFRQYFQTYIDDLLSGEIILLDIANTRLESDFGLSAERLLPSTQ